MQVITAVRFSGNSYFCIGVVGCNQPQARPAGWKFGDRHLVGQLKIRFIKEEPVEKTSTPERAKAEKALIGMVPKMSDKRLRLLTLLAHEFLKKP